MIIYKELEKLLNKHTAPNSKVLEIGAAPNGYVIQNATHTKGNIEHLPGNDLVLDASKLPFKPNSFDMIFMVAVDYYVKEHDEMLRQCKKLLTDKGKLIIATYKQDNLKRQSREQGVVFHTYNENDYKEHIIKAGFNSFKLEKIVNNPPVTVAKKIIWGLTPRFIKLLRSQWVICIASK